jgi:hypothetical protein
MTTALGIGYKMAQHAPNTAGKMAVVGGAVILAGGAIAVKNVVGNLTNDLGKSAFLFCLTTFSLIDHSDKSNSNLTSNIYKLFDLSGDSIEDLLKITDYLNNLQYFFLYILLYISILLSVNPSYIEQKLTKIMPKKILYFFMKSVHIVQKSGRIYLIVLLFLLSYNVYLSNFCFNMLYDNFDAICDLHVSKKS